MKRRFVVSLLSAVFWISCSSPNEKTDKKIFRFNQHNSISSLDPAFASNQANIWAVNQLYSTLLELGDDLQPMPLLVKNWTISDDGLIYTFSLRTDVYFHDNPCFEGGIGRKMTANDVVYSFSRLIDPGLQAKGSWIFKGKVNENNPFVAVNDSLFELHLSKPFRPMLGMLAMQYCSIVPAEAVNFYKNEFRARPVGTGPFSFKIWDEGQTLILTRNNHYFEKDSIGNALPYLDGVRMLCMKERQTAFFEFKKEKLHLVSGLESSYASDLLTPEGELQESWKSKVNFYKNPYLNTEYAGFSMEFEKEKFKNSPLKDKRVRQAMNYAIDKAAMLRILRRNIGIPATAGFLPAGIQGYAPDKVKGYDYNPDKARALLSEAGFGNGNQPPSITFTTTAENSDICSFLAKQWADVGLQVTVEINDSGTLRSLRDKGELQFFRASWIADYPDAENYFSLFYGKNPSPPNFFRFKNTTFDKLYEEALLENDDQKRISLYQEMDKILVEEAPVIFLFYDQTAVFTPKNVLNFHVNPLNLLQLKHVKIQ